MGVSPEKLHFVKILYEPEKYNWTVLFLIPSINERIGFHK
jgi:hypothetical protein